MSRITDELIGMNIRECRVRSGLTVTELARRAGLNKSTVSKIERGRTSPPVSTLVRLGEALDVSLSEFLGEGDTNPAYVLTRKGEGRIITRDGTRFGYSYEALAQDMRTKRVEPFLFTISPGDPPGTFQHGGQEFIYMLSGEVEFSVGDHAMRLKPGDALYYDAHQEHRTRLIGKRPAKFLVVAVQDEDRRERRSSRRMEQTSRPRDPVTARRK